MDTYFSTVNCELEGERGSHVTMISFVREDISEYDEHVPSNALVRRAYLSPHYKADVGSI